MEQHLDQEQLEQVEAAFALFDHDGDGRITLDELRHLYSSLGKTFSEAELRDFLTEVDSDGSGTIEWNEFLSLMVRQLKGATRDEREQGLRNAFEAMDSDNDGYVTLSEFKQLMTNIGTSEDDVERLVAAMDVDGDGKVTYQEYLNSFRSSSNKPQQGFGFTTIPCPARRPTTEDEDVEECEVFEEVVVDEEEEEAKELLEEDMEETIVEGREENRGDIAEEKLFEKREIVEEVFMEAAVEEVQSSVGFEAEVAELEDKVDIEETKDEDDIEEEEKMGEEDRSKEEIEIEVEMEATGVEEEQLQPAFKEDEDDEEEDEEEEEEEEGEEEDEEEEEDEFEAEEEKEAHIKETEVKMLMEEPLEKKIELKKEDGEKIESTVSESVRVKEDVFVREELTETLTTRKSTHSPKKAEKSAVELDSTKTSAELDSTKTSVELDSMKKKRTFRKFSYRGVDLDQLLDLSLTQLTELFTCRVRRKLSRGLRRKPMALLKKLRRAKRTAEVNEKPEVVKTHLRNMIVLPEMVGSIIGVYNGKVFTQVEVKPEMIGHYLGEFSISYKPVKHGRPGIGATHSSRFIPLK